MKKFKMACFFFSFIFLFSSAYAEDYKSNSFPSDEIVINTISRKFPKNFKFIKIIGKTKVPGAEDYYGVYYVVEVTNPGEAPKPFIDSKNFLKLDTGYWIFEKELVQK